MSRILLITTLFPPSIGGPPIFTDRLAHALAAKGHKVTVITASEHGWRHESDAARPFKVWRVPLDNRYFYEIMVRLVLAWGLLTHRTILVAGLELYTAPIARLLRRRYVLRVPGDIAWEQGRNWGIVTARFDEFQTLEKKPTAVHAIEAKRKLCTDYATLVVSPGEHLAKVIAGWGVPVEKIRVIRNGVPLAGFDDFKVVPRQGQLDIIYGGRLTNWKGLETLLLALQGVEGVVVEIIGEGPELPMLTTLKDQLKLTTVRFTGKMSQRELHERMRSAHAAVLLSDYEGMSHALQEAGAAGLARVASNISANADILTHNEDALLVEYGDVAGVRAALLRLRDDDILRQRLGQQAQESIRADDFTRTLEEYVKLMEEKS
jgi:glycosyltransferase involved in cell wall biosynthesis